jgi:hypothetical protein
MDNIANARNYAYSPLKLDERLIKLWQNGHPTHIMKTKDRTRQIDLCRAQISLPDDVWLLIFGFLETARDLSHLSQADRRLHELVELEGWRIFARTRFDSLDTSGAAQQLSWKQAVNSFTWQSRHWDRRSLHFSLLRNPEIAGRNPGRGRGARGPCQTTVAASYTATGDEFAIFGVGENLVARRRRRVSGENQTSWSELQGRSLGLRPGADDIKAVALIEHVGHDGKVAFLEGRETGSLTLRSIQADDFGSVIASLNPQHSTSRMTGGSTDANPSQDTINTIDVSFDGAESYVAATTNDGIHFYALGPGLSAKVGPVAYYDMRRHAFQEDQTQLRAAKWMGSPQNLAIAVKNGTRHTLRYLASTPTGLIDSLPDKFANFEHHLSAGEGKICEYSLTPFRMSASQAGTDLLLSAWRDGTCRLQDIRTPSAFDQTYQDLINPYDRLEVLMSYGTERFVGGGLDDTTIKIFDFRWPKQYYHTSALPCTSDKPYPAPCQSHQPLPELARLRIDQSRVSCHAPHNRLCRWHELSRDLYYRPNADIFLSKSLLKRRGGRGGIWSLAKPADFAPHFYIGISGGIVEASLQSEGPNSASDPHLGYDDFRFQQPLEAALMEAGDGSLYPKEKVVRLPRMRGSNTFKFQESSNETAKSHHRLDRQFQLPDDDDDRS